MPHASIIAFAVLLVLLGAEPGFADKRVALVIGNAAYRHIPALTNPKNDAVDVGKSLRDLGFETIIATDLDRSGMNDALGRFSQTAEGADMALVYYSGHGMQFAGSNYLLPTEARLDNAADVNRFRLMPLDDVLEALRAARGARLLVLDACRNNPVEDDLKRRLASTPGAHRDAAMTRGLTRASAGNGLLVVYSTQANDVASDGTARNSPFTTAFLRHVGTPDIDLRQMLFRVQDEVDRTTGGRQRPELAISLVGEFKLKAVAVPPTPDERRQPRPGTGGQAPSEAAQAWATVKDTTSFAVLEAFIRRFGDTFYADIAHARIEELKSSQTAVVSKPEAKPTLPLQSATADSRFSIINATAVKGDDYARLADVSSERCLNQCAGDPRCKMFAYWRNKACYLFDQNFSTYSNAAAQVGQFLAERPGGLKNVPPRPISVTRGTAVRGDDYFRLDNVAFERCSKQCAEDMRCKMFAYWQNKTCYLFDQNFGTYPSAAAQIGRVE